MTASSSIPISNTDQIATDDLPALAEAGVSTQEILDTDKKPLYSAIKPALRPLDNFCQRMLAPIQGTDVRRR